MTMLNQVSVLDMKKLLAWIEMYICQPHYQLGRTGAVCPFVRLSLEKGALSMSFHYEIDGSRVNTLKRTIYGYAARFLEFPFSDERDRELLALLVIFPNIPEKRADVIDVVHAQLKTYFVQRGLMLGQFHPNCPESAAHNPFFRASVSPFPLFAIRYMALHDILFLSKQEQWFAEYYSRFGSKYELNQVSNKGGLVDLFNNTKERFPKAVKGLCQK
jgi:hypothetical protein